MSTFTKNYDLIKPGNEDFYDIADFNDNMDAIDTILAEAETEQQKISDKIGKPTDMGANTIFGKLNNNNNSSIKSVQKVLFETVCDNQTQTKALKTPVNPNRCIVLMNRLRDQSSALSNVSYTLNATSINFTAISTQDYFEIRVEFWIIELN